MMYPIELFLHDWCTKDHGMCYHVSGIMQLTEILQLNENISSILQPIDRRGSRGKRGIEVD